MYDQTLIQKSGLEKQYICLVVECWKLSILLKHESHVWCEKTSNKWANKCLMLILPLKQLIHSRQSQEQSLCSFNILYLKSPGSIDIFFLIAQSYVPLWSYKWALDLMLVIVTLYPAIWLQRRKGRTTTSTSNCHILLYNDWTSLEKLILVSHLNTCVDILDCSLNFYRISLRSGIVTLIITYCIFHIIVTSYAHS